MARVFRFFDSNGRELHTINDPEDMLPVPVKQQEVSIGFDTWRVDSVTPVCGLPHPKAVSVYYVHVRTPTSGD